MSRKIEIPKEGKLDIKHAIELSADCDRLGIQMYGLSESVKRLIPNESDPMLIRIRERFFEKYFVIISGHLRKTASELRRFVYREIKDTDSEWKKLGRDSERLAFFAHNILNQIEAMIPKESSEEMIKLREDVFKRVLLISSGVLKTISAGIRSNKIPQEHSEKEVEKQ